MWLVLSNGKGPGEEGQGRRGSERGGRGGIRGRAEGGEGRRGRGGVRERRGRKGRKGRRAARAAKSDASSNFSVDSSFLETLKERAEIRNQGLGRTRLGHRADSQNSNEVSRRCTSAPPPGKSPTWRPRLGTLACNPKPDTLCPTSLESSVSGSR